RTGETGGLVSRLHVEHVVPASAPGAEPAEVGDRFEERRFARPVLADEERDRAVEIQIEAADEGEIVRKASLGRDALGYSVDALEIHPPLEGARLENRSLGHDRGASQPT